MGGWGETQPHGGYLRVVYSGPGISCWTSVSPVATTASASRPSGSRKGLIPFKHAIIPLFLIPVHPAGLTWAELLHQHQASLRRVEHENRHTEWGKQNSIKTHPPLLRALVSNLLFSLPMTGLAQMGRPHSQARALTCYVPAHGRGAGETTYWAAGKVEAPAGQFPNCHTLMLWVLRKISRSYLLRAWCSQPLRDLASRPSQGPGSQRLSVRRHQKEQELGSSSVARPAPLTCHVSS